MDVQVVSKKYAETNPVGEGREGPGPLPEPTDRVSWGMAVTDPVKLGTTMVGPKKAAQCKWLFCILAFLLLLLGIFGLLFAFSGTFANLLQLKGGV